VFLAILVLLATSAPAAAQLVIQDRTYDCRVIASTDQFPRGFPYGAPTMNAWGQVAFVATLDPSETYEIRVGRGELDPQGVPRSTPIARAGGDGSEPFTRYSSFAFMPVIESAGRLIFQANDPPTGGPVGIAIYRTRTDQPIATEPQAIFENQAANPQSSFVVFSTVDSPLTDSQGRVLFRAGTQSADGVFLDGNSIAAIGQNGVMGIGGFWMDPGGQPFEAVLVQTGSSGSFEIRVDGTVFDSISDPLTESIGGFSLAGNAVPILAYTRSSFTPTTTWQLGVNTGLGFAPYVDSAVDPFEFFADPRQTSVNAWAEVAFLSSPDGDGETLLVADGEEVWRVLCDDMEGIFGSTVIFDYELSTTGINSDGQIAFQAQTPQLVPGTGEFRTFIVRADPRPGQGGRPAICTGLPDGTPCDDGDPETISSCSAGTCGGEPIGRPTDCSGLSDDTPCDDGEPGTFGYCEAQQCVGVPVPEPSPWIQAAGIAIGLVAHSLTLAARSVNRRSE
jgi:hypothetical protein